jgi:hypothetical protein
LIPAKLNEMMGDNDYTSSMSEDQPNSTAPNSRPTTPTQYTQNPIQRSPQIIPKCDQTVTDQATAQLSKSRFLHSPDHPGPDASKPNEEIDTHVKSYQILPINDFLEKLSDAAVNLHEQRRSQSKHLHRHHDLVYPQLSIQQPSRIQMYTPHSANSFQSAATIQEHQQHQHYHHHHQQQHEQMQQQQHLQQHLQQQQMQQMQLLHLQQQQHLQLLQQQMPQRQKAHIQAQEHRLLSMLGLAADPSAPPPPPPQLPLNLLLLLAAAGPPPRDAWRLPAPASAPAPLSFGHPAFLFS